MDFAASKPALFYFFSILKVLFVCCNVFVAWKNRSILIRRVARIWKRGGGGGAILKEWEVCKRPWSEFSLILNQFHTVCPKIDPEFLGKLENSIVFSAQTQVVSKKKKKKVFTNFDTGFSAQIRNSNVWGGAVFVWGGLFSIFHKKSA